jgi:hypothetical protein
LSIDRRSTAFHEAAHAVVALSFGHSVWEVLIHPEGHVPQGETHTFTISDIVALPAAERRRAAQQSAVVMYAGFSAERAFLGVDVDPVATYEADHVDALAQHFRLGPRGGRSGDRRHAEWHRRLAKEAERIVRRHAGWVRRTAERLLLVEKLSGAEVEDLRLPGQMALPWLKAG